MTSSREVNMMRTGFSRIVVASVLAMVGALTARLEATVPPECAYSFTKGSGLAGFAWCVNQNGNLRQLASPLSAEHIGVSAVEEGYALFSPSTGAVSIDNGTDNVGPPGFSGFPATVVSKSPLTLDRYTGDGRFKLRQKFTTDYQRRELVIAMTVTNMSSTTEPHLVLTRFANLGINATWADNVFDRSGEAVWARDKWNYYSVILSALKPLNANRFAAVDTINHTAFGMDTGVPTPAVGDYGARVGLNIYNLAPGTSRTLTVSYRRQ
jgi:hypothetical protein